MTMKMSIRILTSSLDMMSFPLLLLYYSPKAGRQCEAPTLHALVMLGFSLDLTICNSFSTLTLRLHAHMGSMGACEVMWVRCTAWLKIKARMSDKEMRQVRHSAHMPSKPGFTNTVLIFKSSCLHTVRRK